MNNLFRNLRFAGRILAKNPGFTAAMVLSLALGIGFNTAIFSIVNAVLLRPLPYKDPDRLVRLRGINPGKGPDKMGVSLPDFQDWSEQAKSFEGMAAVTDWLPVLTDVEQSQEILGAVVAHQLFPVLGIRAERGRLFGPQDATPAAPLVVVITHGLWQRIFHGDPAAIGRGMNLSGKVYEVIGVLPADFEDLKLDPKGPPQVFRPIRTALSEMPRSGRFGQAIGRLAPGVPLARAQEELTAISKRLEKEHPNDDAGWGVLVLPLRNEIIGGARTVLLLLLGAVGVVLLIACANVANSLLVRFLARTREIALRTALGASKRNIVAQLLVESTTLAVLGGGLGVLLAHGATRALVASASLDIPRIEQVRTDTRVLLFAVALSLLTGLIFGLLPALEAAKPNLQQSLKEGGRSSSPARHRLRALIVVFTVALSLILLVQAGVLIKSFYTLQHVNPGFDARGVLTLRLPIAPTVFKDKNKVQRFYDDLLPRLAQLPGVQSVGAVHLLPLAGGKSCDDFTIDAHPVPPKNRPCAESRPMTPGYFETMKIPLLQGRPFTVQDDKNSPQVAVINQTMAKRYWADENPIGKRITVHDVSREIVGVVGDVHHFGLAEAPAPEIYTPQTQEPWDFMAARMYLVLRSSGRPDTLASGVRREIAALSKDVPVADVRTMEELVEGSVAEQRLRTLLIGAFALTALVLSAIGLYSVIAYATTQRTHELGIRAAIGARPADIFGMVMRQGLVLTLAGMAVGIVGAIAAGRLVASLLYRVSAYDPVTFAGVIVLFIAIASLAAFVPARRAARVDPALALRYE